MTAHYRFETLGEGVSFGEARKDGAALSNTGILDLGTTTFVFDTSLTLGAAREIREAARSRTGRAPTLAANSHWHLDHILGNQLFADHPIYGTRRTIEIVLEKRAELESELTPTKLESEIRDLERQRSSAAPETGRSVYDAAILLNRAVLAEAVELRLTPPSQSFDGSLRLPGDSGAELRTFGAAHTDSDSFLFVPGPRILFGGDVVVVGSHPNLASGDPRHWLEVLDRLDEWQPERIVPGHGPVSGADAIQGMRDYLGTVLELAQQRGPSEMPTRLRPLGEPDQFRGNVEFTRRWLASAPPLGA
jgi:cyclase